MSCIESIEKPKILSPIDTMVLLLNEGPITGFTRLDKMLFLASKNEDLKVLPHYEFENGNFGPYSVEAFDDLLALQILKGVESKSLGDFGNRIERVDEESIEEELDGEASWRDYPLEVLTLSEKTKNYAMLMRESLTYDQKKALSNLYYIWVHKPLGLLFNYIYLVYYEKPLPSVDSVVYSGLKKKSLWTRLFKQLFSKSKILETNKSSPVEASK